MMRGQAPQIFFPRTATVLADSFGVELRDNPLKKLEQIAQLLLEMKCLE